MEQAQKRITIKAPELRVEQWIDANGAATEPVRLATYKGRFKVIYCFQHWCPGCHSLGLPALKRLSDEFKGNDDVAFFAVQTVFEGFHTNTYERIATIQQQYDLKIPFGHDPGTHRSTIMDDFHTGGTPWFIFIDRDNNIVFGGFHINVDGAILYLKDQTK